MIAVDSRIWQYLVPKATKSAGIVAGCVNALALHLATESPGRGREERSREREVDSVGDSLDREATLCSISAQRWSAIDDEDWGWECFPRACSWCEQGMSNTDRREVARLPCWRV